MYLDKIVETVRRDVAEQKKGLTTADIKKAAAGGRPPRDFAAALRGDGIRLIAEIKRASPSKGDLRPDLDVAAQVRAYGQGGASAISVLTEPHFFKGSLADLRRVSEESPLPALCKDFIIDPVQVYHARGHGADAVLLITAILSGKELRDYLALAGKLGMAALVEVHSRPEMETAIRSGARVIGINNRDLRTFNTDINTTLDLIKLAPQGATVVSESGIHSRADVEKLAAAGVHAILVGEALVTSSDPASSIRGLLGR